MVDFYLLLLNLDMSYFESRDKSYAKCISLEIVFTKFYEIFVETATYQKITGRVFTLNEKNIIIGDYLVDYNKITVNRDDLELFILEHLEDWSLFHDDNEIVEID